VRWLAPGSSSAPPKPEIDPRLQDSKEGGTEWEGEERCIYQVIPCLKRLSQPILCITFDILCYPDIPYVVLQYFRFVLDCPKINNIGKF